MNKKPISLSTIMSRRVQSLQNQRELISTGVVTSLSGERKSLALKVLKEIIDNFGYDKVEKIRNRRTEKEIRRNSRKKDVLTDIFSRILNDKGDTLNWSEHVVATADLTKTMVELAFSNPKRMQDPVFNEFFNKTLEVFMQFRSEAGRA